jgi:hypothetical protein
MADGGSVDNAIANIKSQNRDLIFRIRYRKV